MSPSLLYRTYGLAVFLLSLQFLPLEGLCQSISGYILNEQNEPVPFVNVFVKETSTGTTTDEKGRYYLTMDPGIYNFVFSSLGYESRTLQIVITDKPTTKNLWLQASSIELNEVVVKANRRDPAYEIIQKVIDNREKYLTQVNSFKTQVYVRASETVDVKKKKKQEEQEEDLGDKKGPPLDPAAEAKKKEDERLEGINLVEMQLTLNYESPDNYKEERTAYKLYGKKEGLFIPVFSEADFNFYYNLVDLEGISEVPFISPISRLAVLSYKYKLEETVKEGGATVYKIKFTPRKTGDATGKGVLFINDSTWNINRVEFTLEKGGLKFYDVFTIKQTYQEMTKDLWMPFKQEFVYETKAGPKSFKGSTVLVYTDYQKDFLFPPKFFGNEVSVITKEAFKRDSSYWNSTRPDPLTIDQQKMILYRDSVHAAHNTKAYLDSIEAKYNKVTVGEALYHGFGFRREKTKSNIYVSPLLGLINFEVVAGFRLGPHASYYRSFENGRMLYTFGNFNMGLKNKDWQGNTGIWTRYNPYKLGDASFRIGRSFYSVNNFDAYLNQLRISNYIIHDHIDLFHRIELFNGFYVSTDLGLHDRHSIEDMDATSILNKVIDETDPLVFEDYQAVITNLRFSYTPAQRYMSEPNRKVVLGSKYPTFSINYKKGWDKIFTSDVDFDYLDFTIEQNLLLGTLGNSKYSLMAGKFVNTRDLRFIDVKRFRESDPYLYSDPLHSFQLLDTSLIATDWFFEAHYIHHFNGALINHIPLIKKTKIRTVAGAGLMWIKESNYRHEEIFGGIERVFKLGARRRLRIGVFGVLSQSNYSPPNTDFKISFDLIDTWKRDWSY